MGFKIDNCKMCMKQSENLKGYLSGKIKVLASVSNNKYTVFILENAGQLYIRNDIPEKPIPRGQWMDFWEEDHEKYFGITEDKYNNLLREERALLEAKLQLKLWIEKQFERFYYEWWKYNE